MADNDNHTEVSNQGQQTKIVHIPILIQSETLEPTPETNPVMEEEPIQVTEVPPLQDIVAEVPLRKSTRVRRFAVPLILKFI